MKSSLCILVLAAALQVAVLQEVEVECPNPTPAKCTGSDVCENRRCPRYTSTKCCVELVNGECIAQIRRLPRLNVVTDKCMDEIDSCLTMECSERRTCMEEVIGCPEDNPDCGIRRVKATCVLNEVARAPSSCDEIVCGEGTSCVVSENSRGTRVECMKVEPKSCEDLECDDGMQCVEREKPRCIPIRPEVRPRDCSQLECPETLICMLLEGNRGARCAKPPIPKTCMELECDPGLVCEQVESGERVRCVLAEIPPTRRPPPPPIRIARRCDEIDCEDGYECKLIDREINLNRQPVATCMPRECPLRRTARPPSRCEEIRCERDEMCALCGEGREIRARCMRRGPRDEDMLNMTRPMDRRDQDRDDDRRNATTRPMDRRDQDREDDRTMRRPPMLCSELVCGPEDTERCQELKLDDGRPQRALCIRLDSPDNCKDADCDKDSETCIELEIEEVKVAQCVPNGMRPPRNDTRPEVTRTPPTRTPRMRPEVTRALPTRSPRRRPEGTRVLPTGGPRPTRPTMPDRPRPAERCEELDCGRDFECLHVRRDDRRRAMCVRMRRNEMCRSAPLRPDDDRERPTGEPERDRPTDRPDRERPTDRPDKERPTRRSDRERRNVRQTSDRTPLVDILMAVQLPDLCMARRCCEGESCFVRRMAEDLPPLAFCAPDDFEGERPPMPRPPTCEELLCEEGFECVRDRGQDDDRRPDEEREMRDEEGSGKSDSREDREDRRREDRRRDDDDDRNRRRGGAVCIRRRPDRPDRLGPTEPTTRRPRPTRDPNRPRPTTGGDRPRPTRDPVRPIRPRRPE